MLKKMLFPAHTNNEYASLTELAQLADARGLELEKHSLDLNGSAISFIKLSKKDFGKLYSIFKHDKYIIKFNGNSSNYETARVFDDACKMVYKLERNVVCFNYKGVASSEGKSTKAKDLLETGMSVVQYWLDLGVKPENIALVGHSLGGAVATCCAYEFYKRGTSLKVFNGRSFSKFSKAAAYIIPARFKAYVVSQLNFKLHRMWRAKEGISAKLKHALVYMLVGRYSLYSLFGLLLRPVFWLYNVFTYILLRSVGWEIDAKKAYENLPSNLKCGVYIHTYDSESLEQVAADDEIIHVRASLAYSLSPVKLFDKNKDSMRLERVKASNLIY